MDHFDSNATLEPARPDPVARSARASFFDDRFRYLALAILLSIGAIQIRWGEIIPVSDGRGWDGTVYASAAEGFPTNVLRREFIAYDLQRLLPSAVVNLGLRAGRFERNNANIVKAFQIYNLVLLLASVVIWSLVTRELGISDRSRWLGFCFLFINYPLLKFSFYNPVLTDTTAFALGLGIVYCFLKRNLSGTLLLCAAGAFTWPTFFYSGILLYLFPITNQRAQRPPTPARHSLNTVVASAVSALVLAAIVYAHYVRRIRLFPDAGMDQVHDSLILLSILFVLAYTFTSLRQLLNYDGLFDLRAISRSLASSRVIVVAALFIVIQTLVAVLKAAGNAGGYTTVQLITAVVLESVAKPAIFLVAHVVYYGPVVLFFMYYFRRLCGMIHGYGIGLTLYVAGHLLLALSSESRYLLVVFPVAVILVTKLMDTLPWKAYQGWMICATCFLFSKLWLPINTQGLAGDYLAFPFQFYFMNQGPWMSMLSYAVQTVAIVMIGGLLYVAFFRRVPQPTLGS